MKLILLTLLYVTGSFAQTYSQSSLDNQAAFEAQWHQAATDEQKKEQEARKDKILEKNIAILKKAIDQAMAAGFTNAASELKVEPFSDDIKDIWVIVGIMKNKNGALCKIEYSVEYYKDHGFGSNDKNNGWQKDCVLNGKTFALQDFFR